MSYASVLEAAVTYLQTAVPALTTVGRIHEHPPLVPLAESPCALLDQSSSDERPIAFALQEREWWIDTHVWAYYPALASSNQDFLDLLDQIQQAWRDSPRLEGQGDTATTQVLLCGRFQRKPIYSHPLPWNKQWVRHAVVSSKVQELVRL